MVPAGRAGRSRRRRTTRTRASSAVAASSATTTGSRHPPRRSIPSGPTDATLRASRPGTPTSSRTSSWAGRPRGRRLTPAARSRRILVRPIPVLVEETAGLFLAVTEAIAAHADPRQKREQERRKASADDPETAVERRAFRVDHDQDDPDQGEGRRQHVADDEQRPAVLLLRGLSHQSETTPGACGRHLEAA